MPVSHFKALREKRLIFAGQSDARKVHVSVPDSSHLGLTSGCISRCETLVIGATIAQRIDIEFGHDRYV